MDWEILGGRGNLQTRRTPLNRSQTLKTKAFSGGMSPHRLDGPLEVGKCSRAPRASQWPQ
eukprot:321030-Amphidinium_carterae.1